MVERHIVYYWLTGVTSIVGMLSYYFASPLYTGVLACMAVLLAIYGMAHQYNNKQVIVGVLIGLIVCVIELGVLIFMY